MRKTRDFKLNLDIFEGVIKKILTENGIEIIDGIKRINFKEFDVVGIKGKAVINIQCKNNFNMCYSYSDLEKSRKKLVTTMNSLKTAYQKEINRESVLRKGLDAKGISYDKIIHVVVNRLPIPSSKEICSMNYFEEEIDNMII